MSRLSLFNSPLLLGFDHFERTLDRISKSGSEGYPPYNIEQVSDEALRITLAVAGFKPEDLDITAQQNLLVVKGSKADLADKQYLHLGIANRSFERRFELADFVRVSAADLADGLLTIDLVREVPEAMKPKKVLIGNQKALSVVDGDASAAA